MKAGGWGAAPSLEPGASLAELLSWGQGDMLLQGLTQTRHPPGPS